MFQRYTLPAVVAVGLGGAMAWAAEPTRDELAIQVRQLQSQVAALEARQATGNAVDATVEKILADADHRSQYMVDATEVSAGYDNGFFIKAGDAFLFKPGVQMQFRNVTNAREDFKHDDEWDIENGFELRRLRFNFVGSVFTPKLTYMFQWDTSRSSGAVTALESYVKYEFAPQFAVVAGQYKNPVTHENLVSSASQLAVESSLMDYFLGGGRMDYTQGVDLIWDNRNNLRADLSFNDGPNTDNTNFVDSGTNFGVAGRVEFKAMGDWAAYKDFTARDTKENLLVFGGAGQAAQADDVNLYVGTADVQFENPQGLALYGAWTCNYYDFDDVADGAEDSRLDWGALAQAGFMIKRDWEVFGRYDITLPDSDFSDQDSYSEFTVGVNWYLVKATHRAKVTADVVYLPDGTPSSADGLGILENDDNEVVVRLQFQLLL